MLSLGERIKEIRGKESRAAFAARFAIHANTLLRWENNERQPDAEFLIKIIRECKITPEWLLLGEGSKITPGGRPMESRLGNDQYTDLLDQNNEMRRELWRQNLALQREINDKNNQLLELTKQVCEKDMELERLRTEIARRIT